MPRPVRTPHQPDQAPLAEGLVIQVGTPATEPREAFQIAQRVVRSTLRGNWDVEPLSFVTRDFEVRRASGRRLDVAQAWELAANLRQQRDVATAEPALVLPGVAPAPQQVYTEERLQAEPVSIAAAPQTCAMDPEWALTLSSVQDAWSVPLPDHGFGKPRGDGIVVGHPDTGYTEHPEIWDATRLLAGEGFDFEDGDIDPLDPLVGISPGHGTSTASVIMSAPGGPGAPEFVTGSAPLARLVPLRVSTSVIHLSYAKLTKAINYAVDHGHHVISMSLGGPLPSGFLLRAIRRALDNGVVLLAASGNIWPWVVYPARYDEVIAVGACDCTRNAWVWSSPGFAVDVAAPGDSVWCASVRDEDPHFRINQASGTSFAVAVTAGVCALWLAYHGREQLIQRYGRQNLASVFKEILVTAGVDTPAGWNTHLHGAGILNAKQVLEAPLPDTAPAGGMVAVHAADVPRFTNDFDLFLDYFPDQDPALIRRALIDLLRTDERELGLALTEFGDELLFHVSTNPEIREQITRQATAELLEETSTRGALAVNDRFLENASRSLRERIL